MHTASPQHIWEDDRMEMGRWRGLVSREISGERNGDGEVTSEHHQPHLPHLTANQGPPPPQLVFPPPHIGPFYPTTSPPTIHLWKPSNEGSVLVLAQPPPPPRALPDCAGPEPGSQFTSPQWTSNYPN